MKLNDGPISENQLMKNLAKAKQLMTKVDSGNYETGHINESDLIDDSSGYEAADQLLSTETNIPLDDSTSISNLQNISEEKIDQSNLPDHIKQAMKTHPIPQVKLNDQLDMSFVEKTKKLMRQEGVATKPSGKRQSTGVNKLELTTMLTPIIENIIRKTLDEIVDTKLNQILSAHQTATLNENLVLKVGDSIFKGKITNVTKAK